MNFRHHLFKFILIKVFEALAKMWNLIHRMLTFLPCGLRRRWLKTVWFWISFFFPIASHFVSVMVRGGKNCACFLRYFAILISEVFPESFLGLIRALNFLAPGNLV